MKGLSPHQTHSLIQLVLDLNGTQVARDVALERLREFAKAMPQVRLDLVWDKDEFTQSIVYCVLASLDGPVLSLSAVNRESVPWPLRGMAAVSDAVLVTVNGVSLTVASVISLLDFVWSDKELMRKIIDSALLAKECEKAAIDISDSEREEAAHRFFAAKGLQKDRQQREWLRQRGLSRAKFLNEMCGLVAMEKTERYLVGDRFEEQYRHHQREYRGVRVAQADIPEGFLAIVESSMTSNPRDNLFQLIARVAWETDYHHRFKVEFTELLRHDVAPEFRHLLDSAIGSVCLVRTREGEVRLIELLGQERWVADEVLQRRIVRHLVQSWYADMRRHARVQWNWGKVNSGTTYR